MPEITAFSKVFRDLEALVATFIENGGLVPGHESLRVELEAALVKAKDSKTQQESLQGNRLAATSQFITDVDAAKEAARRLRSYIVSVLGPRSPYLPLFGIAIKPTPNLGVRRRKAKSQPATEKPAPAKPVE
ncbi:MAG TPA: hypothetical protein VGX68_22555 [Thermoanaerobaculia bacterium]|jgi:hypothetical protein|nr:hypothetical protein [Thermoanaerobaculia bacterium]